MACDLKLTLEQICDLLDDQIEHYKGDDKAVLVQACNLIYDHLNKDEPPISYGN